jgi:hypothetical protein
MEVISKKIKGDGKEVYFDPNKEGEEVPEENEYRGLGHEKKAPGKVELKSTYGATVLEAYGM